LSRIGEAEHRCRRCGRTPEDTLMPGAVVHGALAPQSRPVPAESPSAGGSLDAGAAGRPGGLPRIVQGRLFQEAAGSNVLQFPERGETRRRPKADSADRAGSKARVRSPAPAEGQGNLDFRPAPRTARRTLGATVEAAIYCDAPVATLPHRALAAALDLSMIVIGYALLLTAFRLAGGEIRLDRSGLPIVGGALVLTAFAYSVMWVIAGSETAGKQWTGLRLVTFEGLAPEFKHRLLRLAGSWLSACIVVGLVWSLWDEESLTWHDHISGTFPTPLASETRVVHRR
jgi:uncharacterized RDD family membrane protein YckC